jgi:hypothetical protein
MPDAAVPADRESRAAAMEAFPAAKAMKTLSPAKGMESRSLGRETRRSHNAAGPNAMETRAAAKLMKGRGAGVRVSAVGVQARGRRAAAVNMVQCAGIIGMAGQVLDGIYLARGRTIGLVEVPAIAVADGVAAAGGRILDSLERREGLQQPPISEVIAEASSRPACEEQRGNAQGNRDSFPCHRSISFMMMQRPDICGSAMPAAAMSAD